MAPATTIRSLAETEAALRLSAYGTEQSGAILEYEDPNGSIIPIIDADGNVGIGSGGVMLQAVSFAYDLVDLNSGVDAFQLYANELLLDAWIYVSEDWDGTTPIFDLGGWSGGGVGLFGSIKGSGVDVSSASTIISDLTGLIDSLTHAQDGVGATPMLPIHVEAAQMLQVCVSQDGTNISDAPGGTKGGAVVVIATSRGTDIVDLGA